MMDSESKVMLAQVPELAPKPKCNSCIFHHEEPHGNQIRFTCHKNSPAWSSDENEDDFPGVYEDDWCSEHQSVRHLVPDRYIHDRFTRSMDQWQSHGKNLETFMKTAFAYFEECEDAQSRFAELRRIVQLESVLAGE